MALQRAEMRTVRWMCDFKPQDRVPSKGLRDRLGLDDIISLLQQNSLQWYGHVLRKEDNDWVEKCMEYEGQEVDERKLGEIVEKDCQARKLNRENATGHNRWRKQKRDD